MSTDRSDDGVALGETETAASVTPPSTARQVVDELVSRWKHFAVAVVTAATTWFLYGINDTWTKDAMAFAFITAAILGYSLVTLYTDLELA